LQKLRARRLRLGNGGHDAGFRLQALADQVFDLGPEMRIALALDVAGHEGPANPGRCLAFNRSLVVVVTIVAEDLSLRSVGGMNHGAAMDQAVRLVEVGGGSYVVGDDSIALPELGDAVDLHGEQHGDADAIQFAGEKNDGRGSPTVAEQDDMGLGLFLVGQDSIVVAIKQAQNGVVGGLPVTILEDLDVGVVGEILANALRQLYRSMIRTVVAYETTCESDDDRRRGWRAAGDSTVLRGKKGRYSRHKEGGEKNSGCCEARHAGSSEL